MPRPRRTDRSSIATDTLTVRLSSSERRGLDELVERLRGRGGEVSAASLVRTLINAELFRNGIITVPTLAGGNEEPPMDPEERQRVLERLQRMQPLIDEIAILMEEFGDTFEQARASDKSKP